MRSRSQQVGASVSSSPPRLLAELFLSGTQVQRQGRALHPDAASRVGLRPLLPHFEPAQPGAARLAWLLQRTAPAHGARLPAAAGRSPEVLVTNVPGLNS